MRVEGMDNKGNIGYMKNASRRFMGLPSIPGWKIRASGWTINRMKTAR